VNHYWANQTGCPSRPPIQPLHETGKAIRREVGQRDSAWRFRGGRRQRCDSGRRSTLRAARSVPITQTEMFPAAAGTRSTLHAQGERWGLDRRARQMAVMVKAVDSLPDDSHYTRFRIEAAAGMRPSVDGRRLQLFTFLNRGSQGPSHGEKTGGTKTRKVERRRAAGPMRTPSAGCEPTAKSYVPAVD
jgi:hypothetical protein